MAELLLEFCGTPGGNAPAGHVLLSEQDARQLLELMESLLEDERFIRRLQYVKTMLETSGHELELERKLVRLTGKRPIAAGIGMTAENMRKRRVRIGVLRQSRERDPSPVTFQHFLKMEELLYNDLGVGPAVSELLLRVAVQNEVALMALVRAVHDEKRVHPPSSLSLGAIKRAFVSRLREAHSKEMPANKLIGLTTLVANGSVLFTTRDWDAIGVLSQLGAALAMSTNTGSR